MCLPDGRLLRKTQENLWNPHWKLIATSQSSLAAIKVPLWSKRYNPESIENKASREWFFHMDAHNVSCIQYMYIIFCYLLCRHLFSLDQYMNIHQSYIIYTYLQVHSLTLEMVQITLFFSQYWALFNLLSLLALPRATYKQKRGYHS